MRALHPALSSACRASAVGPTMRHLPASPPQPWEGVFSAPLTDRRLKSPSVCSTSHSSQGQPSPNPWSGIPATPSSQPTALRSAPSRALARVWVSSGTSGVRPDMPSGNEKGVRREKPPSLFDSLWEPRGCVMADHSGLTWGALGVPCLPGSYVCSRDRATHFGVLFP